MGDGEGEGEGKGVLVSCESDVVEWDVLVAGEVGVEGDGVLVTREGDVNGEGVLVSGERNFVERLAYEIREDKFDFELRFGKRRYRCLLCHAECCTSRGGWSLSI